MIFGKEFRLIITQNLSSKQNSAIDEALFKNFKIDSLPILRLYSWQNSISFGVGQNPDDYINLQKEYDFNFSKRITGGGVLFHGQDISYSVVIPANFIENRSVKETYELICTFLLDFYKNLGLKASFAKDIKEIVLSKNPFCQVGFEAYDIIINGVKIGGNAQKRSKNVIFQHGSIPLKSFKKSIQYGVSLEDFNINLDFDRAKELLAKSFQNSFQAKLLNSQLNEDELKTYNDLLRN